MKMFFWLTITAGTLVSVSCNNSTESKPTIDQDSLTHISKYALLEKILDQDTTLPKWANEKPGQEVDRKLALECIDIYPETMKEHGFDERSGLPITNFPTTTKMATYSEVFKGPGLLDWMIKTVRALKDGGVKDEDIRFRLCLGVYTDSFLRRYVGTDVEETAALAKRHTIFIVPEVKGSIRDVDSTTKVYELGGLNP